MVLTVDDDKYDIIILSDHNHRQCNNVRFNLSPPGQNGRHFADDVFKCIFCEWKVLYIDFTKFDLKGPIAITQQWFR